MQPKLIAHGGAWEWDDGDDAGKAAGLRAAVEIGRNILLAGGSALDAVEKTVNSLEDCPAFDAGTGGYLNRDGIIQLDALLVDGSRIDFCAVGAVTQVANPISLARKILEQSEYRFFVGDGADKLAAELGMPLIDNAQLQTPAMLDFYRAQSPSNNEQPSGHDTVGAVAIDQNGNVAAATSTSGTPYKPAGRVGDSPLLGSGGYALNGVGTAGATGHGETIMRVLLSKYVCDKLAEGMNSAEAAQSAITYVENIVTNSMSGVIVIDAQGNMGAAHTTPKLAHSWFDSDGTIHTAMQAASNGSV